MVQEARSPAAQFRFFALFLAVSPASRPSGETPPAPFSVSHLQRFHTEPASSLLESLLSGHRPNRAALSLFPGPLTINNQVPVSLGMLKVASSGLPLGQCQGEGLGECVS